MYDQTSDVLAPLKVARTWPGGWAPEVGEREESTAVAGLLGWSKLPAAVQVRRMSVALV